MPINFPLNIIDFDTIKNNLAQDGNCTHLAGHCFGSDGGSGIPEKLKVPPGRGGVKEVWTQDIAKLQILRKDFYDVCQYCGKYNFNRTA